MKTIRICIAIILAFAGLFSCETVDLMSDGTMADPSMTESAPLKTPPGNYALKTTGSVEVLWKSADKGGDMGNKPDSLLCFFEFSAIEGDYKLPPRGEIVYLVLNPDSSSHREIRAGVYGVYVDPVSSKAWMVAQVVYDSKGCSGSGGGHEPGCSSGDHDDTGGGCGEDDTSHDGGCSHDDTGTDGGTTNDNSGGCSNDTGTDGGTTHDDSGGCAGGTGGSGDSGATDMSNPLSGKNCRIGQIIAVKVHDGGTPGTNNDGITWKWFSPSGAMVPGMDNIALWPHLCKKTIIGGNLVVHN